MALSANKDAEIREDKKLELLVEDNVHIYRGAAVCANAAGYAIPGADGAGNVFLGMAAEEVDNTLTGHTQGGKHVLLERRGSAVMSKAVAAQTDVGLTAYISDDTTVALVDPGNTVIMGTVVDVPDSSHLRIAF